MNPPAVTPPPHEPTTASRILQLAGAGEYTLEQVAPFYALATAMRVVGLTVADLTRDKRDPELMMRRAWLALILIDFFGFEVRPLVRMAEWFPVDPVTVHQWRKRLDPVRLDRLRVPERRVLSDLLREMSQPGTATAPSPASAHPAVPFREAAR